MDPTASTSGFPSLTASISNLTMLVDRLERHSRQLTNLQIDLLSVHPSPPTAERDSPHPEATLGTLASLIARCHRLLADCDSATDVLSAVLTSPAPENLGQQYEADGGKLSASRIYR